MPVLTELVRSARRARVACGLFVDRTDSCRASRTRSTATTQAQRATARHAIMPRCSAAAARASRAAARGRPVALGPNDKILTCRPVPYWSVEHNSPFRPTQIGGILHFPTRVPHFPTRVPRLFREKVKGNHFHCVRWKERSTGREPLCAPRRPLRRRMARLSAPVS